MYTYYLLDTVKVILTIISTTHPFDARLHECSECLGFNNVMARNAMAISTWIICLQ